MQAVQVGKLMAAVRVLLRPDDQGADLWEAQAVADQIAQILMHCDELGLAVSRLKAREVLTILKTQAEVRSNAPLDVAGLARAVADFVEIEISSRHFFTIRPENVPMMEGKPGFGEVVATNLPGAAYDIDEAGKCLALSRNTAAVFHLMRVVEAAIKAVSACLDIPDPVKEADRNWAAFMRKIKIAMEHRDKGNPTPWKPGDKVFFESAYAHLDAVRAAWRNPTMHVESKYTNEEADGIYHCVCAFTKQMASRMNELGQPKA